jgi:hypothetical protein
MNPINDAVRAMPLLLTYTRPAKEPRVILRYYLPLDVGTLADLGLPKDLSASEAERLCALVMSLAVPETWH